MESSKIDWEWNYFNIFYKHQQSEIAIYQIKNILKNVAKCQGSLKDYVKKIRKVNNPITRLNLQIFILELKLNYDFKNRIKHRLKLILSKK